MFTFLTCLSNHLIPSTFSVARRVESSEDFFCCLFHPKHTDFSQTVTTRVAYTNKGNVMLFPTRLWQAQDLY